MIFNEIQKGLSRSWLLSFSKKKYATTFFVMYILTFLFVLAKSFLSYFPNWSALMINYSLMFFSLFILFYLVFFLNRLYFLELKDEEKKYVMVFFSSLKKSFAIAKPFLFIILFPLGSWLMFFGVFLIIKLPFIGLFLKPLFVIIPFIINFMSLIYIAFSIFYIFAMAPFLALKKDGDKDDLRSCINELKKDLFFKIALFALAMIFLLFIYFLINKAALLTLGVYHYNGNFLSNFFTLMILMIPVCMIITFPIIFFSNFSAESYLLINRRQKSEG